MSVFMPPQIPLCGIIEAVAYEVEYYKTPEGKEPFGEWIAELDAETRARIDARLKRVEGGNLGDWGPIDGSGGVDELRFKFGPGYRIYFGRKGNVIVILLCGGDKSTQKKDTLKAKGLWADYKSREVRNADSETIGYQDDDFDYAVWQKAGKAAVYRYYASIASYDSLPKSLGLTNDVEVVIKNQGDRTIYEMAFSPVSISPFNLFQGSACRFNLILNMSNGKQRIGWLEISPGIGKIPKKPGIFPDLILVK